MRLSRRVLTGVSLVALVGVGLLSWGAFRDHAETSKVSVEPVNWPAAERSASFGEDTSPNAPSPPAVPSASADLAPDRPAMSWTSGYQSRDPYPVVVALREARQKGTFAASFQLQLACIDALIAISSPPNYRAEDIAGVDEFLQARLQAKQEIEVRCSRFSGQDSLALAEPVPGDIFGERYRKALDVIFNVSDTEREMEALSESIDQGMGPTETVLQILSSSRTWKGESWQDRPEEFDTAALIALRLASSGPSASAADLRDLTSCYRAGSCKDFVSDALAYVPANRRQSVESLSQEMATALRAGDVSLWQRSKPTPKGG